MPSGKLLYVVIYLNITIYFLKFMPFSKLLYIVIYLNITIYFTGLQCDLPYVFAQLLPGAPSANIK